MRLSFIVPVVRPELHMANLVDSLIHSCFGLNGIELIVVNQSQSSISELLSKLSFPVNEIITESVIPAAIARNLGAKHANGEFLFFLDDDAVLVAERNEVERLLEILLLNTNAGVTHRGEIREGKYITSWPSDKGGINQRNFSKYGIEWNLIIRKELFIKCGGFPEIGAGSRHAALSGEAFVLMANLLGRGVSIKRFNDIRVAHPTLLKKENTAVNLLGYFYGAGYSVGVSLKHLSLVSSIYWVLRAVSASIADFMFRYSPYSSSTTPKLRRIGFALLTSRLTGLLNGIFESNIKEKSWLSLLAKKCQ